MTARIRATSSRTLDHIVVRAELEPDHAVDLLPACAHDDDRDARALAQPPADLETVDVRQAQVEQHEVGLRSVEGLAAGGRAVDLHPLPAEPLGERLGDCVLVLDDQNSHAAMLAPPAHPGIR
jgi:hypothetical protein